MNQHDKLELARRLQYALSCTKTGLVTLHMESDGCQYEVTAEEAQRVIDNLRFRSVEAE